ncbi:MAG: PilZ domain-containing protein [Acidobacteria bacterium]|nr:PilZ domain-containing protein [Acidobacteriota bacterium]
MLFSWEGAQRRRLQAEGVTRDISVKGAFILAPTCPPVEATVQVEIFLPSLQGSGQPARIKAESRVLRVEHAAGGNGQSGFAIFSEGFALCRSVTEVPGPKPTGTGATGDPGRQSDA